MPRHATSTSFKKGQKQFHYPKGRKNMKLSEVRKKMFKEGKLKSIFQTEKNPSKMRIPNNGQFKMGQRPWNYMGKKEYYDTTSDEWNRIRIKVWQRDNFTCQQCGAKGVRVDAHHIIPYRISKDNSLKNLVTLCRSCHAKTDNSIIKNRRKGW